MKVKFWSHVKEDVYEMWADVVLSIDSSKAAESLQTKGKDGDSVDGIRHRFQVCLELVHWAMKTTWPPLVYSSHEDLPVMLMCMHLRENLLNANDAVALGRLYS